MIPCCCDNCTVASDSFDRADSSSIGSDWTEVSGDWEIVSNELYVDSSSAAAVHSATVPDLGNRGVHVQVDITCDSTTDAGRVFAQYVSSNQYVFAEVQPGATNGTLKLFTRIGGVNTQRSQTVPLPGFTAGSTITVELCVSEESDTGESADRMWARVGDVRVGYVASSVGDTFGTQGGVGTGSVSSGVAFDNFVLSSHGNDVSGCPDCGPHCFALFEADAQLQLDFTGFANGAFCFSCAGLNTTFVLDQTDTAPLSPVGGELGGCQFAYDNASLGCQSNGLEIRATFHIISGDYFLIVRVRTRSGTGPVFVAEFRYNFGTTTEPDISVLSSTNIPLTSSSGGGVGACNGSAATCTATYIPP